MMFSACDWTLDSYFSSFSVSFDFSETPEGWVGDFADYPENDSAAYGLIAEHTFLPDELDETKKAFKLSGSNGSDDLFMFLKRKLTGLRPNARYAILFNVRVASNAPTGAVGAGGAPGESVYLKVGAALSEPKKQLEEGMYRMNIDIGEQSEDGDDMLVIGNIGVAANTINFTEVTRNNNSARPVIIQTDNTGSIWLIVGSDSGFEGITTLYYTRIDVLFNEI